LKVELIAQHHHCFDFAAHIIDYCFFGAALRQASEQYFTSSQFLAQFFRQVISLPQATQGLLGKYDLLPLYDCCLLATTLTVD